MSAVVRRLAPGIGAILLAASLLLICDLSSRKAPAGPLLRVALLQHVSTKELDEAFAGLTSGLEANGFVEGRTIEFLRFNAEADLATANAIAREIVSRNY